MSSPLEVSIHISRLHLQNNDLSSLVPEYMVYLKDRFIDQIIEETNSSLRRDRNRKLYLERLGTLIKEVAGLSNPPKLSRDLLDRVYEIDYTNQFYTIKINKRAYLEGTHYPVERYFRLLEYGNGDLPPRHMFSRSSRLMINKARDIWYMFYDSRGGVDDDRYRDIRQDGLRLSKGRLRSRGLQYHR